MESRPTVSVLFLRHLISGLRELDVDVETLVEQVGLRGVLERETSDRVPLSLVYRTWDEVYRLTGERGYGLRLAALIKPETWDVFGHLLKSSATLADACIRAGRYMELLSDGVELSLYVEGDRAVLTSRRNTPGASHPESTEFILAAMAIGARYMTGRMLKAIEFRFAHPEPKSIIDYEQFLDAPVYFDRPHNAIVFPSGHLQVPIQSSDSQLCAMLESQAEQLLAAVPKTTTLTRRVQELIAGELRGGNPSADHIADRLGLHPRTLGRHLRKEGTTYQQLLDQLRHDLADRYLTESNMSIGEIAFTLGYANTSAFNKAFRRWTGTAPHEYRRRLAAAS